MPFSQLVVWKKPDIRKLALEAGLPVAGKKDSQGICFLGKVKVPQFLSHFIEDKPGDILDTSGKKLGSISAASLIPWVNVRALEFHPIRIMKDMLSQERMNPGMN